MGDLEALALRCEAATGPDSGLDAEIAIELRQAPAFATWVLKFPDWRLGRSASRPRVEVWDGDKLIGHWAKLTAYTKSLDAAMSLVGYPNGRPHNLCIASAYGSAYIVPSDGASYGIHDALKGAARAQGASEIDRTARAITAAALRARASVGAHPEGEDPLGASFMGDAVPEADAQTPAKSLNPGASS